MLELSDRKFKTAAINNIKRYQGKGKQYIRSDRLFQQTNGKYKKEKNGNVKK